MLSMMDEGKNVWHSERVVDVLATPLLPQATFGRILIYSLLFCLLPVTLNKIKNTVTRTFTQPPSVKYGYPFVGNILSYSQDPVTYLRKATAQFGRIFEVKMILTNTIWLRGNDLNKVYLDAKEDTWSFGDGMGLFLNKVVKPGYFENLKTFVGSLNRGINRKVALDHYTDIVSKTSKLHVSEWSKKPEIEIFERVSVLVHAIIVQCLMGPDFYENNCKELYGLLHDMEADIGDMLNFLLPDWIQHPAARRLRRTKDRVEEIFVERLKDREKSPGQWTNANDYISYTLGDTATAHLKEYYASHHTLLMFAAHTSTVSSISWTIIELLKSPKHIDSLRQNLQTSYDARSSSYLHAYQKETGRLYSGASMLRLARRAVDIPVVSDEKKSRIPQGSVVSISPYLTHRDPNIYSRPDQWHPERWLQDPDLPKRLNSDGKLAYVPFGAGVHRCPGEKLAGIIATTVIGILVQDYNLSWGKAGEEQELGRLDFSKVGSPWLKGDALIKITERRSDLAIYG